MDPDSRSLLTSWCRATIGLLNSGFHLIFVDEFVINRNTIHTYGWAHKGKPSRLLLKPNDFKMSFVVAHSRWRVEGILGTKTTFNQYKFIKFFRHLLTKIKREGTIDHRKLVIVADNCRFHKTENVRQLIKSEQIMWMFIPPYCPEINPCEKLINYIKVCVKTFVSKQR